MIQKESITFKNLLLFSDRGENLCILLAEIRKNFNRQNLKKKKKWIAVQFGAYHMFYDSYLLSNTFLKVLNHFESSRELCGLICLRIHCDTVWDRCTCFVQKH